MFPRLLPFNMYKCLEVHTGLIGENLTNLIVSDNFEAELSARATNKDFASLFARLFAMSVYMGWQKRSTGHSYDSMSGHAALIGARTQKVVAWIVKAKKCSICTAFLKRAENAPVHRCVANHGGSSKSIWKRMLRWSCCGVRIAQEEQFR